MAGVLEPIALNLSYSHKSNMKSLSSMHIGDSALKTIINISYMMHYDISMSANSQQTVTAFNLYNRNKQQRISLNIHLVFATRQIILSYVW